MLGVITVTQKLNGAIEMAMRDLEDDNWDGGRQREMLLKIYLTI